MTPLCTVPQADRFPKFTQVTPFMPIMKLEVSMVFVNDWVFKCGAPDSLVSDNGY